MEAKSDQDDGVCNADYFPPFDGIPVCSVAAPAGPTRESLVARIDANDLSVLGTDINLAVLNGGLKTNLRG